MKEDDTETPGVRKQSGKYCLSNKAFSQGRLAEGESQILKREDIG